jgi:hypothetical protein
VRDLDGPLQTLLFLFLSQHSGETDAERQSHDDRWQPVSAQL